MSEQDDKQEIAELRELNDKLSASLDRCRSILDDCRQRLAANSNDEPCEDEPATGDGESRRS